MNRDQKAVAIAEIATKIDESEAIFAVDYRGITVEQVAELRAKLREADASFKVVKNSLTEIAVDQIRELSKLPSREVLYGQLVGIVASPIGGLVRSLNALIGGLAIALG